MDALISSPYQATAPADAPPASSHEVPNPASQIEPERASADGVNPAPATASQGDRQLHNSQESIISTSSFSSKPPGLFPSSSNVSTATVQTVDSDLTSATSREELNSLAKQAIELHGQSQRPHTPGLANGSKDGGSGQMSSASTSPMSVDTPYLNKGSKRTASGTVKSSVSMQNAVGAIANEPVASPIGRSPKEIAQALRTRLSYAMVKVQNGWEHHTLDELETMTERSLPSTPARSRADTGGSRRLSMFSETSEPYLQSPVASEFSQTARMLPVLSSTGHKYQSKAPLPRSANGHSLEPAAQISGRSNRRSPSTRAPPMLSTADIPRSSAEYPSTPQRQGILRMPSNNAERDAVDTLVFMSSPNNSNNMRYGNSAQASPLRSEFPGPRDADYTEMGNMKKVMFEGNRVGMMSQPPR